MVPGIWKSFSRKFFPQLTHVFKDGLGSTGLAKSQKDTPMTEALVTSMTHCDLTKSPLRFTLSQIHGASNPTRWSSRVPTIAQTPCYPRSIHVVTALFTSVNRHAGDHFPMHSTSYQYTVWQSCDQGDRHIHRRTGSMPYLPEKTSIRSLARGERGLWCSPGVDNGKLVCILHDPVWLLDLW